MIGSATDGSAASRLESEGVTLAATPMAAGGRTKQRLKTEEEMDRARTWEGVLRVRKIRFFGGNLYQTV